MPRLGLTFDRILVVDWLHCLSLGIYKCWLSLVLHSVLIFHTVFNISGDKDAVLEGSVAQIGACNHEAALGVHALTADAISPGAPQPEAANPRAAPQPRRPPPQRPLGAARTWAHYGHLP